MLDLAIALRQAKALQKDCSVIPDTLKFVMVVALIGCAAYSAVWGLATFPPEQAEVVRALPHEKLRQN
jgi:hypothetical protein